jgi:hypothetical protein
MGEWCGAEKDAGQSPPIRRMQICLYLDPSRLMRWHVWIVDALQRLPGAELWCAFAPVERPLLSGCRLLLKLERLLYRQHGDAMEDAQAALRRLPRDESGAPAPDLVIDLAGQERPAGKRVLTVLFNGVPGEIGVFAAVMEQKGLCVELHDSALPGRSWMAHPASADSRIFAASLDGALSCAVALICKAVRAAPEATYESTSVLLPACRAGAALALAQASLTVASKAAKWLWLMATGQRAWGIGWRFDPVSSLLHQRSASFWAAMGGTRSYLADPFPFCHNGEHFVFVEEFLYAKQRGCISVLRLDRTGAGEPRIVLEDTHHLSYPFVFQQDGEIWMIPESAEAGTVALYRAIDFPNRWVREGNLIEDLEAFDATLMRHQDSLWIFASLRACRSTSWDMLGLFHADRLTGPWTPHAANPVLMDAAISRPAGAFHRAGGRWLRPVQDCSKAYGRAISLCRLDRLDETGFAQTPVGRIECESFDCHTYNRRAGLEVIDFCGAIQGIPEVTARYTGSALPSGSSDAILQSVPPF